MKLGRLSVRYNQWAALMIFVNQTACWFQQGEGTLGCVKFPELPLAAFIWISHQQAALCFTQQHRTKEPSTRVPLNKPLATALPHTCTLCTLYCWENKYFINIQIFIRIQLIFKRDLKSYIFETLIKGSKDNAISQVFILCG